MFIGLKYNLLKLQRLTPSQNNQRASKSMKKLKLLKSQKFTSMMMMIRLKLMSY